MNKPIVIEIPDGETVEVRSPEVEVRIGTAKGAFRIVPVSTPGQVRLETLKGVFLAWVNVYPDLVRAAVLAETERCKGIVLDYCKGNTVYSSELCAAIDAPDETVSEFDQGRYVMQETAAQALEDRGATTDGTARLVWANAAHLVRSLNATEPLR